MERWRADLIDRIIPLANEFASGITIRKLILKQNVRKMSNDWYIRESGRSLGPYGLAIRLQQQIGMSWEEATAISGYQDNPSRIHTSKPKPSHTIPIRTPEEIARDERLLQEYCERLTLHMERLKGSPVERIHELMDKINETPIVSWTKPSPPPQEPLPIRDNRPWYKRFF